MSAEGALFFTGNLPVLVRQDNANRCFPGRGLIMWREPVACAFHGAQATGPRHQNQQNH